MEFFKSYNKGILVLIFTFLFLSILVRGNGMTNANSRFAAMQSIKDSNSFKIDKYKDWTVDWSFREGHYYSNKAPGAILIGFPVYLVFKGAFDVFNPSQRNEPPTSTIRSLISLFVQVIPVFLFILFVFKNPKKFRKANELSCYLALLAFLFGNTASLFFNSYFGHGLAALFTFAMVYFLYVEKYFYVGFFFGLALLSDYGAGFYLVPIILVLPKKGWPSFIKGGILPGILWIIYHLSVTGSIFETPNKYINPRFKEQGENLLWGALSLPDINVIGELLWGSRRGILITQPWVLVLLPYMFFRVIKEKDKNIFSVFLVSLAGFILIFLMNASFNGWHGGASAGPRYLSVALTPLCFSLVFLWKDAPIYIKTMLAGGLLYSLLFRALVMATTPLVSEEILLLPGLFSLLEKMAGFKQFVRIPVFLGLVLLSLKLVKLNRSPVSGNHKDPSTSS